MYLSVFIYLFIIVISVHGYEQDQIYMYACMYVYMYGLSNDAINNIVLNNKLGSRWPHAI